MEAIQLTKYSHGAGCGCKISPKVLSTILESDQFYEPNAALLVGNNTRDDAAVYDIGNGKAIISTTDFFMPIVDDPFDFGRIASVNAMSDVYAMGGKPIMGIAILGWPVDKIDAEIAQMVIEGSRSACDAAGISLGGGHSIDNPEPVFGLAVTGTVDISNLKENSTATLGCNLYLTKPLGVGILSTAQKKGVLREEHRNIGRDNMVVLNDLGIKFGNLAGVKAMTDVTGFGLLGHLLEMCEGSGLNSEINFDSVPVLEVVDEYLELGAVPGGTKRNWDSYGTKINELEVRKRDILCDPQTSGGLLVAVEPQDEEKFLDVTAAEGMELQPLGQLVPKQEGPVITVH